MIVEEINAEFGLRTPIICTPGELMEVTQWDMILSKNCVTFAAP
jgi:hypothetical protein